MPVSTMNAHELPARRRCTEAAMSDPDWLGQPLGSPTGRVRQNAWTRTQRNPATERGFKPSPADWFRVFRPLMCGTCSEARAGRKPVA